MKIYSPLTYPCSTKTLGLHTMVVRSIVSSFSLEPDTDSWVQKLWTSRTLEDSPWSVTGLPVACRCIKKTWGRFRLLFLTTEKSCRKFCFTCIMVPFFSKWTQFWFLGDFGREKKRFLLLNWQLIQCWRLKKNFDFFSESLRKTDGAFLCCVLWIFFVQSLKILKAEYVLTGFEKMEAFDGLMNGLQCLCQRTYST